MEESLCRASGTTLSDSPPRLELTPDHLVRNPGWRTDGEAVGRSGRCAAPEVEGRSDQDPVLVPSVTVCPQVRSTNSGGQGAVVTPSLV